MHLGILQAIAIFFTFILPLPSYTTKATWGSIVRTTGGLLILDQYYYAEYVELQPKHKVTVAQQKEVSLINTLSRYMDYAFQTPRFLPRPWRSG